MGRTKKIRLQIRPHAGGWLVCQVLWTEKEGWIADGTECEIEKIEKETVQRARKKRQSKRKRV
jgi:hypothetical protein